MFIWSFKFSLIWFCLCYGACRLSMPHTIAFSLRQNKLDLIRIYYKFGGYFSSISRLMAGGNKIGRVRQGVVLWFE